MSYFTILRPEPEKQREIEKLKTNIPLAKKRILLVDDNLMNQEVAKELLTTNGAIVFTASGGYSAISTVQTMGQNLDMLLIDIQMPDLHGLSAVDKIRSLGYIGLPIIMMTANPTEKIQAKCFKIGAQDIIQKAFLAREIIDKILANSIKHPHATHFMFAANFSERTLSAAKELRIDINAATKLLGGNIANYKRALDSFILQSARVSKTLAKKNDTALAFDLSREIHTVSGLLRLIGDKAGNTKAQRLATAISQQSHNEQISDDLHNKIEDFSSHLTTTIVSAEKLRSYLETELSSR